MVAKKNALGIQEVFVKTLKELVPSNVSLVDEIADILGVSTDSVYRRLRGETEFSLEEIYLICSKYPISIDSLFSHKGDYVTFAYLKLNDSISNFEKYLQYLIKHLVMVGKFEKNGLIYAAEEVPIFHSLFSKKLASFKVFYWLRSVVNIHDYQTKKFSYDIIPHHVLELAQHVHDEYVKVPSKEIWTVDTILTTVRQIEYYWDLGMFKNKEAAHEILDELKLMVDNLSVYAETEKKGNGGGSFQLYNSEVTIGTNCIHVNINDSNYSFISFNTINSLSTANQTFCGEIDSWMKNLIKKSILISGSNDKQRYQFFNKAIAHIEVSKERIK